MSNSYLPYVTLNGLWLWLIAGQYHNGKVWRCPHLDKEGILYKYYQGFPISGVFHPHRVLPHDSIEIKLFDDEYEIGFIPVPNTHPLGTLPGNRVLEGFCYKKEIVNNKSHCSNFDSNDLYHLIHSYKQNIRDRKIDIINEV